jgi:hypothetical protein
MQIRLCWIKSGIYLGNMVGEMERGCSTKYINIQSTGTTVSVPSSEAPTPSPASKCGPPTPEPKGGGGILPSGCGGGGFPIPTTGEKV